MAEHSINARSGAVGVTFALAADTVDTVTFDADMRAVRVSNDGDASLYYTCDGTVPTVGGAKCYYVPAGAVSTEQPPTSGATVVKLIADDAVSVVRVERA